MRLPSSVPVGGIHFTLDRRDMSDEPFHGFTLGSEYRIEVDSSVSYEEQLSTAAHEIVHAALYVTGKHQTMSSRKEEELALFIEHIVFPALRHLIENSKR
jgi:hypothetical protein